MTEVPERYTGMIIRGIGGFYYVDTGGDVLECYGRGRLKKDGDILMVGDIVEVAREKDGCVVESVLPRTSVLRRPPIANADLLIVVAASKDPDPNTDIIDRFLVMAGHEGLESVLCLSKSDLTDEDFCSYMRRRYSDAVRFITVSALTGEGIGELKDILRGRRAAFAGPSGAGKSTLINILIPEADTETGRVSAKTGRGRHTTRRVEIFRLSSGGLIYDTPGFTSFDLTGVSPEELDSLFPDFRNYTGRCRFDDCRHISEPDCAVREAVKSGLINSERYDSYVKIYSELKREQDMRWRQ